MERLLTQSCVTELHFQFLRNQSLIISQSFPPLSACISFVGCDHPAPHQALLQLGLIAYLYILLYAEFIAPCIREGYNCLSLCANSFTKHRLSYNVQTPWTPCPPFLVTETLPSEEGKNTLPHSARPCCCCCCWGQMKATQYSSSMRHQLLSNRFSVS